MDLPAGDQVGLYQFYIVGPKFRPPAACAGREGIGAELLACRAGGVLPQFPIDNDYPLIRIIEDEIRYCFDKYLLVEIKSDLFLPENPARVARPAEQLYVVILEDVQGGDNTFLRLLQLLPGQASPSKSARNTQ